MNASKETAKKAEGDLWVATEMLDKLLPGADKLEDRLEVKRVLHRVMMFVEACQTRLPTEASYERARKKKLNKAAGKYYNAAGDETY